MGPDEQYFQFLKDGDLVSAQGVIDGCARTAGFTVGPVYHGTTSVGFTRFDLKKASVSGGFGVWFGSTVDVAQKFARHRFDGKKPGIIAAHLRLVNPKIFDGWSAFVAGMESTRQHELGKMHKRLRNSLIRQNHDGVIIKGCDSDNAGERDDYAVFDVRCIKFADTVIYDDAGMVIPPTCRFVDSLDMRGDTAGRGLSLSGAFHNQTASRGQQTK